ncbi:MAG: adenylate/guanylate cyclase domain-containing protein [Bacteroidetes bacterium]|nr:adenylate/guanylate cyclase domain-containing protein [Bacteroidota bacterium]
MLAHLQRADRVALRGANPLWVERVDRVYRQLDPGGFGDRVTARFTGRAASELSRGREEIVTSIFADVVGFTRRFEKLGAQEVMDTIRSVFERAVPLFERHRVRPHQYQGDGLVAEAQGPNHESRAIAFARELLTCMNRTSLVRTITGDPFGLQIRVGVATGLVVTGALGSQYKMEYLSIGRSVNMAARLQAEAQPGELVCAQATAKAAGQPGQLEEFQLKGFAEKQQGLRNRARIGRPGQALA